MHKFTNQSTPLVSFLNPGPQGPIGDPSTAGFKVVNDHENPQYVPDPNNRQCNLQDGGYTRINDVVTIVPQGRVEYLNYEGNRSFKSKLGFFIPTSQSQKGLIPMQIPQGPIGWNTKVAETNNALDIRFSTPPQVGPNRGALLRGSAYPVVVQSQTSDVAEGGLIFTDNHFSTNRRAVGKPPNVNF